MRLHLSGGAASSPLASISLWCEDLDRETRHARSPSFSRGFVGGLVGFDLELHGRPPMESLSVAHLNEAGWDWRSSSLSIILTGHDCDPRSRQLTKGAKYEETPRTVSWKSRMGRTYRI